MPCFQAQHLLQYVSNKKCEEPEKRGYVGVQITDQTSITCTLKIGPLYPGKNNKNMNKWAFVLLSIAAIVTVIGLVIWIPMTICCKCVASQLIMGYKGVCGCGFTICMQRNKPLTYRHYCNRMIEN